VTRLFRPLPLLTLLALLLGPGCGGVPPEQTPAPPDGGPPEACAPAQPWPQVHLARAPDGGIQPQALEHKGTVHLVYFKGDPRGGDVYYVKGPFGGFQGEGVNFGKPLRVNSQPGSAIARDGVPAAQLAITTYDHSARPHVVWTGSAAAQPRGPGGATPLLYSRLNDAGTAFEPQRNLIVKAAGLEGGPSLAADLSYVWVYWHAPEPGKEGEGSRRVWMVMSQDQGKTFGPSERAVSPPDAGVSACCGLRAYCFGMAQPVVLYRAAAGGVRRDTTFLHQSPGPWGRYGATKLDGSEARDCPAGTGGIGWIHQGWVAAWETRGQVQYARLDHQGGALRRLTAPGEGGTRRSPVVLFSGRDLLLAWTEGVEEGKGGAVAWQVFTGVNAGKDEPAWAGGAITHTRGRVEGVPARGLISAVHQSDQFLIFY
jgi:hypothetical protein